MDSSSPAQEIASAKTEASKAQDSVAEPTDIPNTETIETSTEADAGNSASTSGQSAVLHIEGSDDAPIDEPTTANLSSADNGDGPSVPAKSDCDVGKSDDPQVQVNGPV